VNVNDTLIGSIYTLKDASSTSDHGHNYIIISNNRNINKFVQAMPITSMKNKKVTIEVPIELSNSMISYIMPYNIQTFTNTELQIGKFRGVISDTDYITSKEFINLLMDIYLMETNIGDIDRNKVMKDYKEYCDKFWKYHNSKNEYRNNNVTSKDDIDYIYKPLSQWTDDELKLYLNNIDNDNPEYSYKSLGFHNIKEIVQFNFQVRKERKNREYKARYIIK
jgi:hypothetical protein